MSTTQDRPEWLKTRRAYLGGTDMAAIVGKNKWASPLSVYESKVIGKPDANYPEAAEAGLFLEPLARDWYERDTGIKPMPAPAHIMHPSHAFLGANPDGLLGADELLEIKTHGIRTASEWGEEMTDDIPDAYHVQCVWYLGLTGRDRARVLAIDTGLWTRRHYCVEADPVYFKALVAQGVKFWREHILTGIPPDATGHPREGDVLRRIHPRDDGETILADSALDEVAERYIRRAAQIAEIEREQDADKTRLMAAIGDAAHLETAWGKFSYKSSKDRESTDWKFVAAGLLHELRKHDPQADSHHGILCGLYTTTTAGSRRFIAPKANN